MHQQGITEFTFADETGEERTYEILRKNEQWTIKWVEELVTQSYKFPSGNTRSGPTETVWIC